MGSTTIRLDEDVYEKLRAVKRDDESFSDAVSRLIDGGSLLDLVGLWSEDTVEEVRDVIADAETLGLSDTDALVDQQDKL